MTIQFSGVMSLIIRVTSVERSYFPFFGDSASAGQAPLSLPSPGISGPISTSRWTTWRLHKSNQRWAG